ncbi:MAG: nucleotidyltransferase domain-containing protein [Methanobacteriota archaeon]|nr:MAG: nucleotidyltransferase domain-containing protein [Euryarchaeota archaeon]
MQNPFKEIVFEFAKQASDFRMVRTVIVFGSVAKGEADARSDVDILVVFNTSKNVNKIKERPAVGRIALDLEKKFDRNIQLIFSNRNFDNLDRQFIEEVMREGVIVYGKVPQIDTKKLMLEPYSLIYFSLKNIAKADKMRLKRALYGHKTLKRYKNKVYRSVTVGLVDQLGGRRTGIASVLIPAKKAKEFIEVLKSFGVEYEKLDVWISKI